MDAKLESIVDQFKARLDELVPVGCREKSLAQTNIEQAQLWAESARRIAHPATRITGWHGTPPDTFDSMDGTRVPVEYLDADGVRRTHPGGPAVAESLPVEGSIGKGGDERPHPSGRGNAIV